MSYVSFSYFSSPINCKKFVNVIYSHYLNAREQDKADKTSEIRTDNTYSVTTTVVKNFTQFDNQKKVICCSNILNRIYSNTSNVNVFFPPKNVRVKEIMKSNEHNGETELKLRCSVEASNPRSSIEWKGVKSVPRDLTMKTYTNHSDTHGWTYYAEWVFKLTKDDNGRSMRCEVKNPQFPKLELVQLYRPNITYAPIITVSGQENGVAYLGDDVFLTCHVDSNPPSTLSWYNQTHLIEELYGAKNFDLQLVNISFDHSQTYTCVAHNSIGSIKSKNVTLVVKDPESQTNCGSLTVETNNLAEEHTAILQFSIHPGRPIKWEKKINSTFQQLFKGNKYEFTKNNEKTIHNLLIFLSKYNDSGEYRVNCDTAVSNSVHLYIEKTFPSAATGSSSLSFVVPVVVGCTVVVVAAVIAVIVFVTCLKRRQNAQVEMKETDQRSTGPGRNDTNKAPAVSEDTANDQREYESVEPVEREETKLNTGAKFVRAKLDLKQASDSNGESRLKKYQQQTNAALYVNTDQQQYESVLPTTDREETHTYSKLGADDEKTKLQPQGDVSLVLAELDLKQNSDNAVRKPLSLPDEQNNESHYVNAKQPVYEELEQKLDKEETHYSKLAAD